MEPRVNIAEKPALHSFSANAQILPRDLQQVKSSSGGIAGELSVGPSKIIVLRISDNLYVTIEKVSHAIETLLALDGVDIHQIRTGADLTQFLDRYQASRMGHE